MISEPFELLRLPKASTRAKSEDVVIVGDKLLFVGVPNSSISTLSLRPPQVLSAHSVPPGTIITAILSSESELVGYATKERNKFYIKLLQAGESSGTKGVILKEVKEEIKALYMCPGMTAIAAIGNSTSKLTGYSISDLAEVWSDDAAPQEFVYSALTESPSQTGTVCITVSYSSHQLSVRTVELSYDGMHTLMNAKVEDNKLEKSVLSKSFFSYNPADHLLYRISGSRLSAYNLPSATLHSQFELDEGEEVSGLLTMPNNNTLVARGNRIELIDSKFQSKIATKVLPGRLPAKLLIYSPTASAIAVCQGNEVILGLTVTPTDGTLFESIGMRQSADSESYAFTDIFKGFEDRPQDSMKTATEQLESAKIERNAVVDSLTKAIKAKDGAAFAEVVTYLKDPSLHWVRWHETGEATAPATQDLVYVDSDRSADSELISVVAELAFLPNYQSFLPQGVAVYLLTHPLFPYGEPKFNTFLRSLERRHPLLYRQAIVSLPGVTATDLVVALLNHDENTFLEAVVRLQEEFGPQQILSAIREVFGGVRSLGSLTVIVERLSRHTEALALIAPFIDAIGLLAWKPEQIASLRERLSNQVLATQSAATIDSVIVDLCQGAGLDLLAGKPVPSDDELQKLQQRQKTMMGTAAAPGIERSIPKYSIETLSLTL